MMPSGARNVQPPSALYDTGVGAIDAMLKGEADMANPTEFVAAGKVLQNQRISYTNDSL